MSYNEGVIKGTLRALNLSYNPCYPLTPDGEARANRNSLSDARS